MFVVVFEVHPKSDQWNSYLGYAKLLRPELERVDGFIDNIRYRSLRRPGWVLSLSTWRDEKALVRWRTVAVHHDVQARGRNEVFRDYHLRVGQVTADTHTPEGHELRDQRLDETETGAKHLSVIQARRPDDQSEAAVPEAVAAALGVRHDADGIADWDVFDAILAPGDMLALASWQDAAAAGSAEAVPAGARCRRVRVVRDYGMADRREAPQYFPPAASASPAYEVRKPPDATV